jgi:hypothetical protein
MEEHPLSPLADNTVGLDLAILVAVFALLWVFFRKIPVVFVSLFVIFVILYSIGEVLTTSTSTVKRSVEDGYVEYRFDNHYRSPFHVGFFTKWVLCSGLSFTGVLQTINALRGDRKYTLTKSLSRTITSTSVETVKFRSYLRGKLPDRVIFICQHVGALIDCIYFNSFIPDTHAMTVMNDWGINDNVAFLGYHLFLKNLYGSFMINRRDKKQLKRQITQFANKILMAKTPEVFCIWASGQWWDKRFPNGIKGFKPGASYLSAYAQIPVCIVHGKTSEGGCKQLIVEQSDLIHPPAIDIPEGVGYFDFYNNPDNKAIVDEYHRRVELQYRKIDDAISKELLTRTT